MKPILCALSCFFLLSLFAAPAEAQVKREWEVIYASPTGGDDQTGSKAVTFGRKSVVVDGDGNVFVTGKTSNGTNNDLLVLKYNADGALLWSARYDGDFQSNDNGHCLALASDGSVYAAGATTYHVAGLTHYVVVRFDANGNQLWDAELSTSAFSSGLVSDILVDEEDNVYVTGQESVGGLNNYLTVKLTPAGSEVWRHAYDFGDDDRAYNMALDSAGNLYVVGQSRKPNMPPDPFDPLDYDFATVKYDPDGNFQTAARYDSGGYDVAFSIGIDASDNIFVSGQTQIGAATDISLIRYDTDLNEIWTDDKDLGADDRTLNMRVTANGNVHIVAYSIDGPISHYVVIKYDLNGGEIFTFTGPTRIQDRFTSIDVDPEGNIYAAGSSLGGVSPDTYPRFAVAKINPEGVLLWEDIRDKGLDEVPIGVTFDQNRNVYASGVANNGNDDDVLTVKYITTDPTLRLTRGPTTLEAIPAQASDSGVVLGQWRLTAVSGNGAIDSMAFVFNGSASPDTALTEARLVLDSNHNGAVDAGEPTLSTPITSVPASGDLSFALSPAQVISAGEFASFLLVADISANVDQATSVRFSIASPDQVTSTPWIVGGATSIVQGNLNISGTRVFFGSNLGLPAISRVTALEEIVETGANEVRIELRIENVGGNTLQANSAEIILRPRYGNDIILPLTEFDALVQVLAPGDSTIVSGVITLPADIVPQVYEVDARYYALEGTFFPQVLVSDTASAGTDYIRVIDQLALTATSLPNGTVGKTYRAWVQVQGGAKPVVVEQGDVNLPAGLTLTHLGVLQGIPQSEGSYTVSVKSSDARGVLVFRDYSLTIEAATSATPDSLASGVTILTQSLPAGLLGHPYAYQMKGLPSDGLWALASGTLPPGIALSEGGEVSGLPTAAAAFAPFTLSYTVGGETTHQVITMRITSDRAESGDSSGLGTGSASGLNVDVAATSLGGVYSVAGDEAQPATIDADPSLNFADLASTDSDGPLLLRAWFLDRDGDNVSSTGDLVRLTFNEVLDLSTVRLADFSLSGGSFGAGALIGRTGGATSIDVILGSGPMIEVDVTQLIVNSPANLEDPAGNFAIATTVLVGGAPSLVPGVVLTSLNGESVEEFTPVQINWRTLPPTEDWSITIDLESASGMLVTNLATSIPDSGTFVWNVPTGLAGDTYRILISGLNNTRGQAFNTRSANPFSVLPFGSNTAGPHEEDRRAYVRFVSPTAGSLDETSASFDVEVELIVFGGSLLEDLSVDVVDTLEGSGMSGVDYAAFADMQVFFPAGSATGSTQSVQLAVINDTDYEPNETIILALQNSSIANTLAAPLRHRFTITDDDFVPSLVVRETDLSGTEIAYNAAASGLRIFPTTVLGQRSRCDVVISIESDGFLPLILGTPVLAGTGAGSYSLDTTGMSGTLPVGSSTSFRISFAPGTTVGFKDARIEFTHNARNAAATPFIINIRGEAVAMFSPAVHTAAGLRPRSAEVADFDEDGDLDVATLNVNGGQVTFAFNDGNGVMTAGPTPVAVGTFGNQMESADLNNDGHIDLIVPGWLQQRIDVLFGNGDGTFQAAVPYATTRPLAVKCADFNRDGWMDVCVSEYPSTNGNLLRIMLNNGDGTLSAGVTLTTGLGVFHIDAADLNHDGIVDLMTSNLVSNDLSLFFGVGDGTFAAAVSLATGLAPRAVEAGDVDRDGLTDLVVANGGSASVSIFYNLGAGTFGNSITLGTGNQPYDVGLADINQDGWLDVLTADLGANVTSLFLGNNGASFQARRTYATGSSPTYIRVADMDRDGWQDAVIANYLSDNVSVLLNRMEAHCEPGFDSGTAITLDNEAHTAVRADFDRDGDDDLITLGAALGGSQLVVMLNDGAGAMTPQTGMQLGSSPQSLVKGDFNRDGWIDLAATLSGDDAVIVLLNDQMGSFTASAPIMVGSSPMGMVVGDFNFDGTLDLIVACSASNDLYALPGVGDGSFGAAVVSATGTGPSGITSGDFDGDGRPDIVVGCNGDTTIELHANAGGLNFAAAVAPVLVGNGLNFMRALDRDRDGDLDLLVLASGDDGLHVIDGDGAGGLAIMITLSTNATPTSFELLDVNVDGARDIIITESGANSVSFHVGDSLGGFGAADTDSTLSNTPTFVIRGDFNRDGLVDVISLHGVTGQAELYLGANGQ